MRATLAWLSCLTFLTTGCASVEAGDGLGASSNSRLLVGIVHLRTHEQAERVVGWQTGVIGAEISQRRLLIGAASEAKFEADPAKCQVIIVIKRKADVAAAQNLVNQFKGGNACIADMASF